MVRVRVRLSAVASRMDFTMDRAVWRFWEESEIADWIIWSGVGFGGRLDWEREEWHW